MQRILIPTLFATLIGCSAGQVDSEDPIGGSGGDDDIGTTKGYSTVRVFVLAGGVTPDFGALHGEGDDVTPDPPEAPGGGDYGTPRYYCPPDETGHETPRRDPENEPEDESIYSLRLNVAGMSLDRAGDDSVVLANSDMEFAPNLPQSGIVLARIPVGSYEKLSFTIAPREGFYPADEAYIDSVASYNSAHQAAFAVDTSKSLGSSSVYMAGEMQPEFNFGGADEEDYLTTYCSEGDEEEFCEHLDAFLGGVPFEMRLSDRMNIELAPAGGIEVVEGEVTNLIVRVDSSEWNQDWVSPLVHFWAGPVHINDRYNTHWSETAAAKVANAFTLE